MKEKNFEDDLRLSFHHVYSMRMQDGPLRCAPECSIRLVGTPQIDGPTPVQRPHTYGPRSTALRGG